MKIRVVRFDGSIETLTLTWPIEIQVSEGDGMNCLKTATGTSHFFLQDGTYDGWGMNVAGIQLESPQEGIDFALRVDAEREIEPPQE